jgi:nucleotide-binding universal stress UspA family protein
MFSKVVLALDGTAACEPAVEAAKLAAEGGHVTVVHVQTFATEVEQKKVVDAQIAELNGAGITTDLEWPTNVKGAEADEIARVAEGVGAEAIVVAARGLSPVKGVVLGSTTQRLLHEAKRPIIVVPLAT